MSHRVHLEELSAAVDRLKKFEGVLQQHFDAADAQARKLAGSWDGDAAAAYQEAHEQWRSGARLMHEALQRMQRNGDTAHGNYQAAGTTNAAMWQL